MFHCLTGTQLETGFRDAHEPTPNVATPNLREPSRPLEAGLIEPVGAVCEKPETTQTEAGPKKASGTGSC